MECGFMSDARNITPAKINEISINDTFWSPIMELVRTKVLPYQWEALNDRIEGAEPSHCMNNFKVAARLTKAAAEGCTERGEDDRFGGFVFQDSDFAKWIEAVGYTLMNRKDEELEQIADGAIDIVCAAQQPDGYLDTYYIINGLDQRFTNLRDNHELYCLGHLMEGAVAYYQATGKRKLLDAVIRYTDLVDLTFGPEPEKLKGYPGHEILEMALIRLYQVTGETRYVKLAKYFIDERGQEPLYFVEEEKKNGLNPYYWRDSLFRYQYAQAGKPVRKQEAAEGHAVRAVYLYSGMADVARLTGDTELKEVCDRLWDNITGKQLYITGGIGSSAYGEAFTYDYDLPNDTVYAETCASIGLAFFANRMLCSRPNSKYSDVLEKVLYNGILSGMSLDGTKFFYVNPLEVIPEASEKDQLHRHVRVERQKWFGCACCPPNLARILSSLGQYAYGTGEDTIFLHLYISGTYCTRIGGRDITLKVTTDYPWGNQVAFELLSNNEENPNEPVTPISLAIRIPGWCKKAAFTTEGKAAAYEIRDGYAYFTPLKPGDRLLMELAMPAVTVAANPKVRENIGKVAVMRGPLVYCLEEADNGKELHRIWLESKTEFTAQYEPDLLGGIVTLHCTGQILDDTGWTAEELYSSDAEPSYLPKELTLIPYYVWANRTPGEMRVWINRLF